MIQVENNHVKMDGYAGDLFFELSILLCAMHKEFEEEAWDVVKSMLRGFCAAESQTQCELISTVIELARAGLNKEHNSRGIGPDAMPPSPENIFPFEVKS